MSNKALNARQIALNNLMRKPARTVCLVILVAVLAFTLLSGSILAQSLQNGLNSVQARLGADIMAVPKGYETRAEGALLRGEASAFYFDSQTVEKIKQVPGIAKITPQFYLTSFKAGCCSQPVQLIGFDPATDFVVQPWVQSKLSGTVQSGELVIGSDVHSVAGGTIKFFNQTYNVAAKLDKTGAGFDTSVFMTTDTALKMLADAKPLGYGFFTDGSDTVSSLLIRVEDGYDAPKVADSIRQTGADAILSQNLFAGLSGSLNTLVSYIYIISIGLWVLAVIVLVVAFTATANERKKEYAILRTLGAARKKLAGLVLWESSLVSLLGSAIGTAFSFLIVFPFSAAISAKLQLPFLQPSAPVIILLAAVCFLLSYAAGPLASLYTAVRISRAETYINFREGD